MAKTKDKQKAPGKELEDQVNLLFEKIFNEIGYLVLEVRSQWAGTQNGFDVRLKFLDDEGNERCIFFECKDYNSPLDWNDILIKIVELETSNYAVDGFIAVSPKVEISNIQDNMLAYLPKKFLFPIEFWTPDSKIAEIFSLDKIAYEKIYGIDCPRDVEGDVILKKFKGRIDNILNKKKILKYANKIEIAEATREPNEATDRKTNLDDKLNAVLDENDPDRIEYHKLRCNYKIYLEDLQDKNTPLKNKISKWQENLTYKAKRLTKKFSNDNDYSPRNFFDDFFEIADKDLLTFFSNENLYGETEKLLHGVVFELAAECPLDWRKNAT